MIVIDPITIVDAFLTSSSVPEVAVAAYDAGTSYGIGARRGVTTGTVQAIYDSLQSPNLGHTPASSPTWWSLVGMVYATYSGAVTYGLGDIVTYVATDVHLLYESLAAGNLGHALSDATKWLPRGATNRQKMFDGRNDTQTESPEYIEVELSPIDIATGVFLGGLYGDDISITVTDPIEGVVYTETQSLIQSNSGSSFYNWRFKRIARRTVALSVLLPPYATATIKIRINKPGGIAKCGKCDVGPVLEYGFSQYGLGTDIRDWSTTLFNADGTSTTVERGYSKRMTLDVVLNNDVIDSTHDELAGFRNRNVIYIGSTRYGATAVSGRFSSFKNIIQGATQSRMALQIEGTI